MFALNSSQYFILKTAFLKFIGRVKSIIKPFQNHNIFRNGAIFTAHIHEKIQGRKPRMTLPT